jgi:hypothetical protein
MKDFVIVIVLIMTLGLGLRALVNGMSDVDDYNKGLYTQAKVNLIVGE